MIEKSENVRSIEAGNGRVFATFPAAVIVFVVDDDERLLVLSSPRRQGWWEVVNGAMEAGETVLAAALRETREEAGPDLNVQPLGAFHVESFDYDPQVQAMLSICFLMRYVSGPACPGDDMAGSRVEWWDAARVETQAERCIPPLDRPQLARRAIETFRLWRNHALTLQPTGSSFPGKYNLPPA